MNVLRNDLQRAKLQFHLSHNFYRKSRNRCSWGRTLRVKEHLCRVIEFFFYSDRLGDMEISEL